MGGDGASTRSGVRDRRRVVLRLRLRMCMSLTHLRLRELELGVRVGVLVRRVWGGREGRG